MPALRSNVMLKLGLITVPVAVETAVQADVSFNTLCRSGHDPVKTKQDLHCPQCDSRDRGSFVKGREVDKGRFVIVDDDTIKSVGPSDAEKNSLDLTAHPAAEVATRTLPGGKVYFLTPGKTASDHYGLLVDLVRSKPDVTLCTVFAVRSKAAMYRLGTFGDALTLTELAWPDAVKAVTVPETEDNAQMLALAQQFVDGITAAFDPATYRDTRAEKLAAFIAAAEGVEVGGTPVAAPAPSMSLMEQLAAAVDQKSTKPAPKRTRKPRAKKEAA